MKSKNKNKKQRNKTQRRRPGQIHGSGSTCFNSMRKWIPLLLELVLIQILPLLTNGVLTKKDNILGSSYLNLAKLSLQNLLHRHCSVGAKKWEEIKHYIFHNEEKEILIRRKLFLHKYTQIATKNNELCILYLVSG